MGKCKISFNLYRTQYRKNDCKLSEELTQKLLNVKTHKELIEIYKNNYVLQRDGFNLQCYPELLRDRVDLISNLQKNKETKVSSKLRGAFIDFTLEF